MRDLGWAAHRAIPALCATLHQAWQLDPSAEPPLDKAAQLAELVDRLWRDLGRPCDQRVRDLALRYAESRSAGLNPDRCRVLHGDPHPGNTLRARPRPGAESGFVFVDPERLIAEPEYDCGVILREWCAEILAGGPDVARDYCALLATRSGLDADAIWAWGFLERVSTGLFVLSLGAPDIARSFLDSAEAITARRLSS
jgi:streptomycin 6-kinase